jgi:PAS domain S-box-containing protein
MGAAKRVKPEDTLISSVIREDRSDRGEVLSLRAIIDASDDAIIGKTLDGTIVSWNKGAEKIYGYKAEEILGQPISILMPPGHKNEFPEIVRRLRRGEHIDGYETTHVKKNGDPVEVSVNICPVKSEDGTVVGASVIARDITQQRQAHDALHLSEERFRVVLKNKPVVVFTHDLRLRYTWIRSSVLALNPNLPVGTAAQEYLGRTDAEIFGGEDGERLTAIKEEVLRTGIESHTECTVTLKGKRYYFDLLVRPLRDPTGRLLGLLCSAIDITSLKETITKLQQALDEVQLLSGLLPTCASCKRIRDERGLWQPMEVYIQARSEAKFSHGVCPDCMRKLYPEYRKG